MPSTIYCPQCGAPATAANQQFCGTCGHTLATILDASPNPTTTSASANPFDTLIQDSIRRSGSTIVRQVRSSAEQQLRVAVHANQRKLVLYGTVALSAIVVGGVILGYLLAAVTHLLFPAAVVILLAFFLYNSLRRRLRM